MQETSVSDIRKTDQSFYKLKRDSVEVKGPYLKKEDALKLSEYNISGLIKREPITTG